MTFQLIVRAKAEEDIAFGRDFYHDIRPKLARDYRVDSFEPLGSSHSI